MGRKHFFLFLFGALLFSLPVSIDSAPIPTLDEHLSPAQLSRKIRTLRQRIASAPEDVIPSEYKTILLEVFDDMARTPMGRSIFENAHPDLTFRVKVMERSYNGSYVYDSCCLNFAHSIFDRFRDSGTLQSRFCQKLYLAHVIAHEITHSIQHCNNMNERDNLSFPETIIINKIFELHAILNQTIVRYQLANLPDYRSIVIGNEQIFVPMHRFYHDLFTAYLATGMSAPQAHRAARTRFVETFWQNNGGTPIRIGNRTVTPCDETIRNWNNTYSAIGFKRLSGNNTPYSEAMRPRGIEANLRRFTAVMGIDTPPSFFTASAAPAFQMPTSRRLITYANGEVDSVMDALTIGMITKEYRNGKLCRIIIESTVSGRQERSITEYHEDTRTIRATYTWNNGKMNGIYREYDTRGRQIMEVPVVDDKVDGHGWVLENGRRIPKIFYDATYLKDRSR